MVLLSCKAFDLEDAIKSFAPAVGPNTSIIPLLNGMLHSNVLDEKFGAERVLGGLCAIADAIEMQAEALARFVPGPLYVIADNSTDQRAAAEIAAIAVRRAIPYVRLPEQPLRDGDRASRAQVLALNWAWRNIVRPGEPEAFGFSTTTCSRPRPTIRLQFSTGNRSTARAGSSASAGSLGRLLLLPVRCCQACPLDFGQAWFVGSTPAAAIGMCCIAASTATRSRSHGRGSSPYRPGADPVHNSIQWCGGVWLHEVGQTRRAGRLQQADDKRRMVRAIALQPTASRTGVQA